MAKPLRSDNPTPSSVQFSHFGVLDTGQRSRAAAITSISINVALLLFVVILGMVVKKNPVMAKKVADMYLPPKPVEVPKPPPPPPPPPPKLPPTPKIEPPKIKMPEPKIPPPPEIKPVIMPKPAPVITPPAPKKIDPPPAPKVVSINNTAAHIPNNDAHPTAVKAGFEVLKTTGPAVATKVNLGGGIPGMPSGNTGNGPRATTVSLGSGAPNGDNVNSHAAGAVKIPGSAFGQPGGTGKGAGSGPRAVAIAPPAAAVAPPPQAVARTVATAPVLTYKPAAVYTEEARQLHLEGAVQIKIRVTAQGTVEVLGVTHGLGHGLDEQAQQVARGMRFKPALDATGHPIDQTIEVLVRFQLS